MNIEAEYNLCELKKELNAIEEYILGLRTPVEKYICDENGKITDEKITEFTNRVISRECYLFGCDIGISGVLKRYYELLFYLIFRSFDPYNKILYFSDILDVTTKLQKDYRNRTEFLLRESGRIGGHINFFARMQDSCRILGGRPLTADMEEEKLEQMKNSFNRKTELMKKWTCESDRLRKEMYDKYKEYGLEGFYTYWDALANEYWYKYPDASIPEEDRIEDVYEGEPLSLTYDRRQGRYLTVAEEREWIRTEEDRKKEWIESFEDPQKYLDAYREFCELNWCVNVIDTKGNLRDHLLDILESDDYNRIGDDDKFLRLRAEIVRSRKVAKRQF